MALVLSSQRVSGRFGVCRSSLKHLRCMHDISRNAGHQPLLGCSMQLSDFGIDRIDALAHVAGAMVFNDVSARDLQLANQLWTGGKAIDTFAPCGPAIVTMDEIGDIQNLRVQTRVDGEVLQDGNTASMIFDVAEIVTFLSRIMTLKPGDIIATGTPAGVAKAHTPPRWLRAGHVVEVEIESLGVIRNTVQEAF